MIHDGAIKVRVYPRDGLRPVVEAYQYGERIHRDSFDPSSAYHRSKFAEAIARRGVGKPAEVIPAIDALIVEAHDAAALEALEAIDGGKRATPVSIGAMVGDHPHLREPIIEGILRRGETANIIAAPKVGKSWLAYHLALCVATGSDWLGRFPCRRGRVLLIDNELHPETLAHRIPSVAYAMRLPLVDYEQSLDVLTLRGRLSDLHAICRDLERIEPGTYSLVVLDAWYRALPPTVSENDNGQIANLYNLIDTVTHRLECAWVNNHHASKGSQTAKEVTDVGAGAGSQSRAADTHIVLRPHEEEGAVVMEAAVRSFAPVEPLPLRWVFPLWQPDMSLDPSALKGSKTRHEERQSAKDAEAMERILGVMAAAQDSVTPTTLREQTGFGAQRLNRLLAMLKDQGKISETKGEYKGKPTREFSLTGGVVV